MSLFSISQLASYSGIKPHTIRMWEQRYNAFQPARSSGNTRYYDDNQLRRLLNIVSMLPFDHKVSELCKMPDDKLSGLVIQQADVVGDDSSEYYISQLINAGMGYNEVYFDTLLHQCSSIYGVTQTYIQVIYPLLVRVGLMWAGNEIPSAKEHFISNLIRRKLLAATSLLSCKQSVTEKWILFLPDNEYHEIGLLFANYLIRQSGQQVIYLGSSVSQESITEVMSETHPDYLLFFMTHYDVPKRIQEYINDIKKKFQGRTIYVAGNSKLLSHIAFSKKVVWLNTIQSLQNLLKRESNHI